MLKPIDILDDLREFSGQLASLKCFYAFKKRLIFFLKKRGILPTLWDQQYRRQNTGFFLFCIFSFILFNYSLLFALHICLYSLARSTSIYTVCRM